MGLGRGSGGHRIPKTQGRKNGLMLRDNRFDPRLIRKRRWTQQQQRVVQCAR